MKDQKQYPSPHFRHFNTYSTMIVIYCTVENLNFVRRFAYVFYLFEKRENIFLLRILYFKMNVSHYLEL